MLDHFFQEENLHDVISEKIKCFLRIQFCRNEWANINLVDD